MLAFRQVVSARNRSGGQSRQDDMEKGLARSGLGSAVLVAGRVGLEAGAYGLPLARDGTAVACGAQEPVKVVGSTYQGQVGERLREIAQRFPREANLL
jgi:hypothetical protein